MSDTASYLELFNELTKGNPLAKQAMPAAGEAFSAPPGAPSGPDLVSQVPGPGMVELMGGSIKPFDPKITGGNQGLVPPGPDYGPAQPPPKEGLDWTRMLSTVGAGMQDIGGILSTRHDPGNLQALQQEDLRRRQAAFQFAMDEAQKLPPSVMNDPNFNELRQAQMDLIGSLQKGDVSNDKAVQRFLGTKAKYAADIERATEQHKMALESEEQKRKFEQDMTLRGQQAVRWQAIAAHPEQYPPEVVQDAQNNLFQLTKDKQQFDRQAAQDIEDRKWRDIQAQNMAADNARANAQLGLSQKQFGFMQSREEERGREKALSGAARTVQAQINQHLKIKAAEARDLGKPFNEAAESDAALIQSAPIIEQAVGLQVSDGLPDPRTGTYRVMMLGKPKELNYDPTTKEGKMRLLRDSYAALNAGSFSGDLSLTDLLGSGLIGRQ